MDNNPASVGVIRATLHPAKDLMVAGEYSLLKRQVHVEQEIRDRLAKRAWSLRARSRRLLSERLEALALKLREEAATRNEKEVEKLREQANKLALEKALKAVEVLLNHDGSLHSPSLTVRIRKELERLTSQEVLEVEVDPRCAALVRSELSDQGIVTQVTDSEAVGCGRALIRTTTGSVEVDWAPHFRAIEAHLLSSTED